VTAIDLGYRAREQFVPFHKRKQRWACIVAHRRAGKTVACVMDLVDAALRCEKPNPRFAYIAPYYTQAKDIAWAYVKEYGTRVPGAEPNESELRLDLPNGGRVRLYGADNYDRLRGLYFDGVVLDEYADMDPRVWPQVVRPALSDRLGWATFIGTPKGRNDFWRIWAGDMETGWPGATNSDDWFDLMLKASETGIVAEDELADAKRMLAPDEFEQEYECSFEAAIKGAFYADELKRARLEGRIATIPIDRGLGVWTAWDLGVSDSTAIWFGQTLGREERIIDYYEAAGVGLDHYAAVLREKGYHYTQHYLPHDVAVRSLSTGVSRVETLRSLGIEANIVPRHNVMDGINATRRYIDRCWFDEHRCKRGLEALTQYRRDYDEKLRIFKSNPLHDWTSHGADAFRSRAAIAEQDLPQPRNRYRGSSSQSTSWMAG
jgi:phage terminase large subunit